MQAKVRRHKVSAREARRELRLAAVDKNPVHAGLAGANRILESAGMLGSLMGCSFEALMIDNDMLGMAQMSCRRHRSKRRKFIARSNA